MEIILYDYTGNINTYQSDLGLLPTISEHKLFIGMYCHVHRIMSNGEVYLKRQMYVPHSTQPVHSAFCPLMSFLQVR